jgi:hypothetical protein
MEPRTIAWEALEHYHYDRASEWFWILGIFTLSGTIAALLLGNTLFAIVIAIGGTLVGVGALREPHIVRYEVTQRGIKIDETLYPYTTLESFCIDEEHIHGPQLFVKSEKFFMPLIIIPLPEDAQEEIENIIAERIPEIHIEEPLAYKLLAFFKF